MTFLINSNKICLFTSQSLKNIITPNTTNCLFTAHLGHSIRQCSISMDIMVSFDILVIVLFSFGCALYEAYTISFNICLLLLYDDSHSSIFQFIQHSLFIFPAIWHFSFFKYINYSQWVA